MYMTCCKTQFHGNNSDRVHLPALLFNLAGKKGPSFFHLPRLHFPINKLSVELLFSFGIDIYNTISFHYICLTAPTQCKSYTF
jgi:hypothetical protein